jgi:hypothetical protein
MACAHCRHVGGGGAAGDGGAGARAAAARPAARARGRGAPHAQAAGGTCFNFMLSWYSWWFQVYVIAKHSE